MVFQKIRASQNFSQILGVPHSLFFANFNVSESRNLHIQKVTIKSRSRKKNLVSPARILYETIHKVSAMFATSWLSCPVSRYTLMMAKRQLDSLETLKSNNPNLQSSSKNVCNLLQCCGLSKGEIKKLLMEACLS